VISYNLSSKHKMPTRIPTQSDFPSHLVVAISHSALSPPRRSNVLLLLHGLGDSAASFSSLGRALNLPETICITVQAPTPLPLELDGFHWGDDVIFDPATGSLDMDAGFSRTTKMLVDEVIGGVLISTCGYRPREVLLLGLGQGGMAALAAARALDWSPSSTSVAAADESNISTGSAALAGVISNGAPYPFSASTASGIPKSSTPVLLVASQASIAVTDVAVQRTREVFDSVEVHRWARKGDGMPRNREEMFPVMQFLARRLTSQQGVPEGSIEIT
jgi:Phospholipase/Carboxylesterase